MSLCKKTLKAFLKKRRGAAPPAEDVGGEQTPPRHCVRFRPKKPLAFLKKGRKVSARLCGEKKNRRGGCLAFVLPTKPKGMGFLQFCP